MKRVITAGLIAGFVSSIVLVIFAASGLFELFSVTFYYRPVDIQTIARIEITQYLIWGIIWSLFYAFFYDYIPGKGIKKGLIFGLIIWILSGLRVALTMIPYGFYMWTTPYAIATFFSIVITYGLLIGILYKKE